MKFFTVVYLCIKFCNGDGSYDPLTAQSCNSNEFDCQDGTCIDVNAVCDNHKDCRTGADEHNDFCRIIDSTCRLSAVLPHMIYTLNYTPKSDGPIFWVPEFVQGTFTCEPGYTSDQGNSMVSTCIQDYWEPPIFSCLKSCADFNTTDIQQVCFSFDEQINCNGVLMESTRIQLSCQQPLYYPTYDEAICQHNGNWSVDPKDIKCHPSCGLYENETEQMLKQNDFPWRVLISEGTNKSVRFFSGTLIDANLVLTDRYAFNRSINPDDFLIIVNDDLTSWGPLKSYNVKEIHLINQRDQILESPKGLGGLAIFETVEAIEFGMTVFPACISSYSHPEVREINGTGQLVTVGNVNEHQDLNRDEISKQNVLSLEDNACSKLIGNENWHGDQFCGVMLGGTKLTDADHGTGLFRKDERTDLYLIEGVLGVHSETANILTFTYVSEYIEWIEGVRQKVKLKPVAKKQPPPRKSNNNILILFVLLSFVILIAVFLRVR